MVTRVTCGRRTLDGERERPSDDAVRFWVETRLRDALDDREAIQMALAMLKVGHERGDAPEVWMRKLLANFVFDALGLKPE